MTPRGQDGPWRCPLCGGFMTSGTSCVWTKRGSRFEACPGVRPGPRRDPRSRGRGIGNKPVGWTPDK